MKTMQWSDAKPLFLRYGENGDSDGHRFGGAHEIRGAACPNCIKPLLRFFTLDCRDARVGAHVPGGAMHLLFCWTCNLAQGDFFYQLEESGVALLKYGKGGVVNDFPYEDYPRFFPKSDVSLLALPEEAQSVILELNRGELSEHREWNGIPLDIPHHQLGGVPLLVNEPKALRCPQCRVIMPFLAAVADDCLDPRGFTGNAFVQVLYSYCAKCAVLGVRQQTD